MLLVKRSQGIGGYNHYSAQICPETEQYPGLATFQSAHHIHKNKDSVRSPLASARTWLSENGRDLKRAMLSLCRRDQA